jgi:xanthine dehydrogenase accessory factor
MALAPLIDGSDWPLFGWTDDIRPALAAAIGAGRPAVLGTLYKVEGSAPRGVGAQMLFDGSTVSGYFSGDCIEGDVARHAFEVLESGQPQRLIYGAGSPWIDIRLRCGGALHVLIERIAPNSAAAHDLLALGNARRACVWSSDGVASSVFEAGDAPSLHFEADPFRLQRFYAPHRRLIITGGDPVALALARLGVEAQFETWLVRRDGPDAPPPLAGLRYARKMVAADSWTAFVGATHEDGEDLAACIDAVRQDAAYVGMIGARVRADGRRAAMRDLGASGDELARIHLPAGIAGLGKSAWEVAVSVMAEVMQAMNPVSDRA